jgi:hypothetical protein
MARSSTRKRRALGAAWGLALVAAAAALWSASWSPGYMLGPGAEDVHAEYPNREAVVADGAVARGWIPEWLPASAKDIRESHNLDTNRVWLKFEYDSADRTALEAACARASGSELAFPGEDARRSWWPRELTADGPQGRDGYRFFTGTVRAGTICMALEEDRNVAWTWCL